MLVLVLPGMMRGGGSDGVTFQLQNGVSQQWTSGQEVLLLAGRLFRHRNEFIPLQWGTVPKMASVSVVWQQTVTYII